MSRYNGNHVCVVCHEQYPFLRDVEYCGIGELTYGGGTRCDICVCDMCFKYWTEITCGAMGTQKWICPTHRPKIDELKDALTTKRFRIERDPIKP